MANELYLSYAALGTAATQFATTADDLEAHLPIWSCETGIVDITAAITTLTENTQALATNLTTLSTITTEVRAEVITVDQDQQLRYPPLFGGGSGSPLYPPLLPPTDTPASPLPADPGAPGQPLPPLSPVGPSYVNPDGTGDHLDLPPELTPMGPYAPGQDPS